MDKVPFAVVPPRIRDVILVEQRMRNAMLKSVKRMMSRIRAVNVTAVGGVQLEKPIDTSFDRAQHERELRREIYLLAGFEAYLAKDGQRRFAELMVPEVQAVEKYLAQNPEVRRWVDRNIECGSCAEAAATIRERRRLFREDRLAERGVVPERIPNPEFEWLREAARGARG